MVGTALPPWRRPDHRQEGGSPMAGDTSVDVQGMIAAQGHFQNALDQTNTAYSNMSEQQSNLMSNWTGEAASSFGQALTQYLDDLQTVQKQLATITEALSQN